MASLLCPHCQISYVGVPDTFHDRLQCRACGGMFIVEIKDGRARTVSAANFVLDPPAGLDPQLSSDLKEVCACFNADAYKAAVVMARRFLEALLDKRGFKGRNLLERIRAAHEAKAVSDLHFQLASSMRIIGNYGAHYSDDQLAQIGRDEAELVLNMVRQILKSVGAGGSA